MSLKYRVIVYSSIGCGISILVGTLITAVSATMEMGDGNQYLCAPAFAAAFGGQIPAFVIQTLVLAVFGMLALGLSSVYFIENWSIFRATTVHFSVTVVLFYLMAFLLRWWSIRDVEMCLIMLAVFIAEYVVIWLSNYLVNRMRIRQINKGLKALRDKASSLQR